MEIKWYLVGTCCMGLVNGKYMPFPTENDYLDYIAELLANNRQN